MRKKLRESFEGLIFSIHFCALLKSNELQIHHMVVNETQSLQDLNLLVFDLLLLLPLKFLYKRYLFHEILKIMISFIMTENHIQELPQESILMGQNNTWNYMISSEFSPYWKKRKGKTFPAPAARKIVHLLFWHSSCVYFVLHFLHSFSMENFSQIKVQHDHHQDLYTVNTQQMKLLSNQRIFKNYYRLRDILRD